MRRSGTLHAKRWLQTSARVIVGGEGLSCAIVGRRGLGDGAGDRAVGLVLEKGVERSRS